MVIRQVVELNYMCCMGCTTVQLFEVKGEEILG